MLKFTRLSKITALLIVFLFGANTYAQVGIGTTAPAGGSVLDITSANKGILIPRVNITNLANIGPITGGNPDGLLVWSTNATNRGYHYWSTNPLPARWVPLLTGVTPTNSWSLAGNVITAANFLGTTNNLDLNIRTNNISRMRIQADGLVTVNRGAATAFAGDQFSAFTTNGWANNGYATTGVGVYGETNSLYGVQGVGLTGRGVLGQSTSQVGVQGESTNSAGVVGFGGPIGTYGIVTAGFGARGDATSGQGVYGQTDSANGVWGQANTTGIGVRGQSGSNIATLGISTSGVGVQGQSSSNIASLGISASNVGVQGQSGTGNAVVGMSTSGNGVVGTTANNAVSGGRFANSAAAGHGMIVSGNNQAGTVITATAAGSTSTGLQIGAVGFANSTTGTGIIGVGINVATFLTDPAGSGVAGTGTNLGVAGYGTNTTSRGVLGSGGNNAGGEGVRGVGFDGTTGVTTNFATGHGVFSYGDFGGTGAKFFHIDHPMDPSNKYLNHANIESNEILNLYRGTEIFDGNGRAIVSMPDYYDAININASYQLTAIGAAMPNLYIEKEIVNGQFIIAGGIAGKKVSWQLTAERNDPYMQKYPEKRNMVIDKGEKRGTYLMPGLYGKSEDLSYSSSGTIGKTNSGGIPNETSKVEIEELKLIAAEAVKTEKALELKNDRKVEIEKATSINDRKKTETKEITNDESIMKKIEVVEDSKVRE